MTADLRCLRIRFGGRGPPLQLLGRHGGRRSRTWRWSHRRHDSDERLIYDGDASVRTDDVEKLNHIARTHSDAAVTGAFADEAFFRCAVNIDVTAVSVRVLRFQAAKPKDSRDNGIAPGRVRHQDFAGAPPIFEDG